MSKHPMLIINAFEVIKKIFQKIKFQEAGDRRKFQVFENYFKISCWCNILDEIQLRGTTCVMNFHYYVNM